MVRQLSPLLLLLACAGCASDASVAREAAPTQANEPKFLELAGSADQGKLGLFKDQTVIKVGDAWEKAKQIYPMPRSGYDVHDLPSSIPEDKYEAHGWETPTGEGFGVITTEGKVVMAMYQLEHTKLDNLNEFVTAQKQNPSDIAPTEVAGKVVHFWFWSDKEAHQTLMVSSLATPRGLNVTLALGDDKVLQRVGISPENASRETTILAGDASATSTADPKR